MSLAKRFKATFAIYAPEVTIRPRMAWYWHGIVWALAASLTMFLLWLLFNTNQKKMAGVESVALEEQLSEAIKAEQQLTAEDRQNKSVIERLQQQMQIERAAQAELSRTLAQFQEENASLKEELTFFRNIMSSGKVTAGISIQNFHVEADTLPNEYRFHALLVQGGQRNLEFTGNAQLVVSVQKNGSTTVLTLPDDENAAPTFEIKLKYYQSLEGRFKVEPGAVIKSIQLRIIEKATGQVRLTRSFSLS